MELPINRPEKIQLKEINPYLTCYLCKGYLIDATAISECLHTFCRTCIIKYLQDHSYCPICEVIINKAKPNLKLDKTLQDIVYKLVPELFLREMTRRKQFYLQYPQVAARVTPEERGEDTERTIFNPQDCISLSLEYVSDDSAPNAIRLPCPKNGSDPDKQLTAEESQALMKRYLQCPGMCRIEVLKKFVRNKYNVDTSSFYIDILYKKVPLPDHYTLIDIAYIYSWKRNEPMKFFFRITDNNNTNECFDLFNTTNPIEFIAKRRTKVHRTSKRRDRRKSAKQTSQETLTITDAKGKSECDNAAEKEIEKNDKLNEKTDDVATETEPVVVASEAIAEAPKEDNNSTSAQVELSTKNEPPDDTPQPKPAETEPDPKLTVTVIEPTPTNVTPNRTDNVEVTKPSIDKTDPPSPKIAQQTPKADPVAVQNNSTDSLSIVVQSEDPSRDTEEERKKLKFLHSMQLIPKSPPQKSPGKSPNSKRKTASPAKSDKSKKIKSDKKPNAAIHNLHNNGLKSIIENCKIPSSLSITIKESDDGTKALSLPPVKNFIEILKLPSEIKKDASPSKLDFKFCDNDSEQKVDQDLAEIARSLTEKIPLSTTISQIVGPKPQFAIPMKPTLKSTKESKKVSQGFQKIFEESIKKPERGMECESGQKAALNLSHEASNASNINNNNNNNKRKILEIASQLYKKTKLKEQKASESKKDSKVPSNSTSTPKVPIPRLSNHRVNTTSPNALNFGQTLANMHSNALGLNYTISVGQNPLNGTKPCVKTPEPSPGKNSPKSLLRLNSPKHSPKSSPVVKHMYAPVMDPLKINTVSPKLSPKPSSSKTSPGSKTPKASPTQPMSPNQILEKYNIQNLAQLTASLNFGLNQNAQLAALQQAMMYKHLDNMQSRQGWLNQAPMLQYEKYLQSLKTNQNHLLGNIKEN